MVAKIAGSELRTLDGFHNSLWVSMSCCGWTCPMTFTLKIANMILLRPGAFRKWLMGAEPISKVCREEVCPFILTPSSLWGPNNKVPSWKEKVALTRGWIYWHLDLMLSSVTQSMTAAPTDKTVEDSASSDTQSSSFLEPISPIVQLTFFFSESSPPCLPVSVQGTWLTPQNWRLSV